MADDPSAAMNTTSAPDPDTGGDPNMGGDLAAAIALLAQTLATQNIHPQPALYAPAVPVTSPTRLREPDTFDSLYANKLQVFILQCSLHFQDQMTNQLPPPPSMAQDIDLKPIAHISLSHTIEDLWDLVFSITLRKTEKAKTVKVPTDTLHLLRNLTSSAFTCLSTQGPLSESRNCSRLDVLDKQLVDVQALLATLAPTASPPPQKCMYTAATAITADRQPPSSTSTPCSLVDTPHPPFPPPVNPSDPTLAQKLHNEPVLPTPILTLAPALLLTTTLS